MDLSLQPVMEFRAPIVALRNVPSGTQVSYGGVYQSGSNIHIGVIQCGFADGFPRPW
jgi:alanine racemase